MEKMMYLVLHVTFIYMVFGAPSTPETTPSPGFVPPLITVHPRKLHYFRPGEAFTITCVASGSPSPVYTWTLNGKLFDPSGDESVEIEPGSGTLLFFNPQQKHTGRYQCSATNRLGVAVSTVAVIRVGYLKEFPETEPRTHRPALGASLHLACGPPASDPPGSIQWQKVTASDTEPIPLSDRVSIDPLGNLNFANIVDEDNIEGHQYACAVFNDVVRRQYRGAFAYIIPMGGIPERHPPSVMWTGPTQQIALRGETWKVKCIFSGNPTPNVTWTRGSGGSLPPHRLESHGQELVIPDIKYEDAGDYECEGINQEAHTPIRKSYMLTVNSAPYWKTEPESVTVAEGSEAKFVCEADGRSSPKIDWFINGVPINDVDDDPRRTVDGGTITFSNLTINDAMVFQCNASNAYGYLFKNAYLNVQVQLRGL